MGRRAHLYFGPFRCQLQCRESRILLFLFTGSVEVRVRGGPAQVGDPAQDLDKVFLLSYILQHNNSPPPGWDGVIPIEIKT